VSVVNELSHVEQVHLSNGQRPPYQLMPPLSEEERQALKEDIRRNGVLVPVEKDEHGNVLDSHHRVALWEELRAEGVAPPDYPVITRPGLTEEQKRAHVRSVNLNRRHLTREQRRALVAEQLKETPDRSNRAVAEDLGVDHKTVGAVREGLEATGELPQLAATEGKDGRRRRAGTRASTTRTSPTNPHACQPRQGEQGAASDAQAREDVGAGPATPSPDPDPAEQPRAGPSRTGTLPPPQVKGHLDRLLKELSCLDGSTPGLRAWMRSQTSHLTPQQKELYASGLRRKADRLREWADRLREWADRLESGGRQV
jgi:ParB-like chromosome segregation protein Spo0J